MIDVSGRKYKTQKATLETSPYFRNLLARWDDCSDKQEDGSYYIDADAEIFHHVLNFMRRPSRFPLFWTKEIGFDHALYTKLEAEADYFLLHDLRDWIRNQHYEEAVKTVVDVIHHHDEGSRKLEYTDKVDIQSYFGPSEEGKQLLMKCGYHLNNTRAVSASCGDCAKLLTDHGPHFSTPRSNLTTVITRLKFDSLVCMNENVSGS
jgi:hypothetical protein